MGLYYTPPPPHIGAAQPLAPKQKTPVSGPPPQNPVFNTVRAAIIGATVITAWSAPGAAAPAQPQTNRGVAALSPAPPPRVPLAPRAITETQANWVPVPWYQPPPPWRTPPVSALQSLPAKPQSVPIEVLVGWASPPLFELLESSSQPAVSAGDALQTRLPRATVELQVSWLPSIGPPLSPPKIAAFAAPPAVTQTPPAARPLAELQSTWASVAWAQPKPAQLTLSVPQAPPVRTWSVPSEVLVGWLPPAPQPPVVAYNLNPPISGPAPQAPPVRVQSVPTEILIGWLPPAPQAPVAANLDPPVGATAASAPPIRTQSVPTEVLVSWLAPTPVLSPAQPTPPSTPAPAALPPRSLTAAVEIRTSWLPVVWAQPNPTHVTASGPTPQAPPSRVQSVQTEVLVSWLAPPALPAPAQPIPPAAPATAVFLPRPTTGAAEVQASWLPIAWAQPARPALTASAPQAPPPLVSNPAIATWQPTLWAPQFTIARSAALQQPAAGAPPPMLRSLAATLTAAWQPSLSVQPNRVRLTASGPSPTPPPLRVQTVPAPVLAWLPAVAEPSYWLRSPKAIPPPPPPVIPGQLGPVWWINGTAAPGVAASVSIGIGQDKTYQIRLRSLYLTVSGGSGGIATAIVRDGTTGAGPILFMADLYTLANSRDVLDFNDIDLRAVGPVLTVEFLAGTPGDIQQISAHGDYIPAGIPYGEDPKDLV